jgi:hypothetical protein
MLITLFIHDHYFVTNRSADHSSSLVGLAVFPADTRIATLGLPSTASRQQT